MFLKESTDLGPLYLSNLCISFECLSSLLPTPNVNLPLRSSLYWFLPNKQCAPLIFSTIMVLIVTPFSHILAWPKMLLCSSWQYIFLTSFVAWAYTKENSLYLSPETYHSAPLYKASESHSFLSPRVRRAGYKKMPHHLYPNFRRNYMRLSPTSSLPSFIFYSSRQTSGYCISSATFLFLASFLSRNTKRSFFLA